MHAKGEQSRGDVVDVDCVDDECHPDQGQV